MKRTWSRRNFMQTAGVTLTAAAAGGGRLLAEGPKPAKLSTPSAAKIGWSVAMSMYTFRSMSFYDALPKIAALGVQGVEPAFFLRLRSARPELQTSENLPPAIRKEMKQRMQDHGIRMPNFYANVTGEAELTRRVFEFAKEMGAQTIVAEPPPAALDLVERMCDEYEINLAIHNHPKGPNSRYWDPAAVLAACQGRGKRMGACCDTGHWIRSELRVIPCLKKMQGRILSIHLKDVGQWGKPEARDVPLGEGLADYGKVLAELKQQEFQGVMTVEYEHESEQLLDDVAKCLAFVEKTAQGL